MQIPRCVNLDWLECYCLESAENYPHDARYFQSLGYHVVQRDYGTPIYAEMFTIYGRDDHPLIEVRRDPKEWKKPVQQHILDQYSCHIRLVNRACYFEDAAGIMQDFIQQHNFQFSRISRMDVCLDFVKFDCGDDPQKFITRYLNNRYAKINQTKLAVHGTDWWDGRGYNSLKWGNDLSMVTTKLYNKTMELKERSDKPYIRQAWRAAGLVDDDYSLVKYDEKGEPHEQTIWRVEFSVKSGRKNWFVVEDESEGKRKYRSIHHTLDMYHTRPQLLDVFMSLAEHYFHFKKVEYLDERRTLTSNTLSAVKRDYNHPLVEDDRKRRRKSLCADKILFRTDCKNVFYKVRNVASDKKPLSSEARLLNMLYRYREESFNPEQYKAATAIIEDLERMQRLSTMTGETDRTVMALMRLLIARRIKGTGNSLTTDLDEIRALIQMNQDIFD